MTDKSSKSVIQYIPIFAGLVHVVSRKRLIVERNGPKFGPHGYVFSVYRVLLTVKCSSSVSGYSVHFRVSGSLYLEKLWSYSKIDQNLGLRCNYLVPVEYF